MLGRIAFVVSDDRSFAWSSLPLVRAARELGLDVDVVAPIGEHRAAIEAAGARVNPLQAHSRSLNPMTAGYAAGQLAAVLKRTKPDLVHAIGLGACLIGGAACAMAGIDRRIYTLGPLGLLAIRSDLAGRASRRAIGFLLRGPLRSRHTRYVVANTQDALLLGLDPARSDDVVEMRSAGIDPERLRPLPMPALPSPLRVAIAAPMVWAKGIDVAVEALRLVRARGQDVELSLYDTPDGPRGRPFGPETLARWGAQAGIAWRGPAPDAAELWGGHHAACLPSRGGEGLPQVLLEAAACGRPIVATDVPGCRGFVTDGAEGYVVPPDDPAALAEAFGRLAADPVLLPRMGAAARARVLHGFTERDVMDAAQGLYRSMLAR
jgi:glycosyltransferase involved in cell wall biosynthesis